MLFDNAKQFPYEGHEERLRKYEVNRLLLKGNHYDAFRLEAGDPYTERYSRLRYIVVNFNGLIAKTSADMLFGEDVTFLADKNQEFIDGVAYESKLETQLLESALTNSALGDAVFKVRVTDNMVYIDDVDPAIYYPEINSKNPRKKPESQELCWIETIVEAKEKKKFLIREIHTKGLVETKVHTLEKKQGEGVFKITGEMDVKDFNKLAGTKYEAKYETKIDKPTLVHIPNFRYSGSLEWEGVSDFIDIETLAFEMNNRLTKVANILDKHSDPILAVPEGVLDEEGNVRKEAIGMFEIGEDGTTPEYIVWNASLENAFKELDKIVEYMMMVSETSPDLLGMGKQGVAESGRALKMRLIRTLFKVGRKKKYYEQGLKEVFEIAQMLSKENGGVGIEYNGTMYKVKEVEPITIKWSDGIPNDIQEEIDVVTKRLENETMNREEAIMQLDGKTRQEAEQIVEEIDERKAQFVSIFDQGNEEDKEA
jgi:hypothetical protein